MKWLAPCLLATAFSAQAALLDHIAYTSEGIVAECSDYLGKVSSGGPIMLRDFLIQQQEKTAGCSLNARGIVQFVRGTVEKAGDYSCIAGARVYDHNVGFAGIGRSHPNYDDLTQEMYALAARLEAGPTNSRIYDLNLDAAYMAGEIVLNGQSNELLIVRVTTDSPVIEGLGVRLMGSLRPENIVWHFTRARSLKITTSGVDTASYGEHIGMPGTFLAPYAEVTFNNALITGALYARRINGSADRTDCYGRVSGQLNPAPLKFPTAGKPPVGGGKPPVTGGGSLPPGYAGGRPPRQS